MGVKGRPSRDLPGPTPVSSSSMYDLKISLKVPLLYSEESMLLYGEGTMQYGKGQYCMMKGLCPMGKDNTL